MTEAERQGNHALAGRGLDRYFRKHLQHRPELGVRSVSPADGRTARASRAQVSADTHPDVEHTFSRHHRTWIADQRIRIGRTLDEARPPFEWVYEISSDMGESEYFKHYLVRESDIVLAQRKVLTVIDDEEAAILRADLEEALQATV